MNEQLSILKYYIEYCLESIESYKEINYSFYKDAEYIYKNILDKIEELEWDVTYTNTMA